MLRCSIAYLNNKRFVSESRWNSHHTHVMSTIDEILNSMENTLKIFQKYNFIIVQSLAHGNNFCAP